MSRHWFPDLQQRKLAMDIFFEGAAGRLGDLDSLRARMLSTLSREAIGWASSAFNDRDYELCHELQMFAIEVDPSVRASNEWRRLSVKQLIGPRAWSALQPVHARVKQLLLSIRRWYESTDGIWESLAMKPVLVWSFIRRDDGAYGTSTVRAGHGKDAASADPVVSVIMSVYNGAAFLSEAVESMLKQTFRDFEFIIVDDGSTDESRVILEEIAAVDARLSVIVQPNRGLVDALNRAIHVARGKFIARMDADDVAIATRLEKQLHFMNQNPSVAVVGGAVEIIDARGVSVGRLTFPRVDAQIRRELESGGCPLCHPTVLMRTDAVRATGGYRPVVVDAEDYDLWLRLADKYHIGNLSDIVLKYRRHPGQVSLQRFKRQALSSLAARASAGCRRRRLPDFLEIEKEISSEVLVRNGIDQLQQMAGVARAYLTSIRSLIDAGELVAALDRIAELEALPLWNRAEDSLIADRHLLEAYLNRRACRPLKVSRA